MCMLGLGILSEQEARNAVNWEVYITIAAAFGIGTALVNSGVAGGIANFLVKIGTSFGEGCKFRWQEKLNYNYFSILYSSFVVLFFPDLFLLRLSSFIAAGLFAAVYLATFLISNVVTNNAAAALIFPIAMDAVRAYVLIVAEIIIAIIL